MPPHPDGEMPLWYLATCEVCRPRLPQPFTNAQERCQWAELHGKATGHPITETTMRGNPA